MDTEQAESLEAEAEKKLRKAEIKAAEKAKKVAKAEKKLAKLAEKAAKQAEKAQRKNGKKLDSTTGTDAKSGKAKAAKPKSSSLVNLSLGAKLQAVSRFARSNLAGALLQHGLYAGQEQVLFLLEEHGPLALAELAEKLDVSAPTITKTVTRMEAQEFLSRAVSREDARSIIISLTPTGRRVLKIGRAIVQDIENKTFSALSKAECNALETSIDLILSRQKQQE